jgi:Ca2+-binding RTX toxin-like protein
LATFNGTPGPDQLNGTSNADTMHGFLGSDTLFGFAGNDSLDGGDDEDFIDGGAGQDTLLGGTGDDALSGGLDADLLNGGDGFDVAFYDLATGGVTVDLTTGLASGAEGADTLVGIEDVLGSAHSDMLTGASGSNELYGGLGNDTLLGMDDGDYLEGHDGEDSLVAGNGRDTLNGGDDSDFVDGGEGRDTAAYAHDRADYSIGTYGTGLLISRAGEGTDTVSGVEQLSFDDGDYMVVTAGIGKLAAQVVGTLFGAAGLADKTLMGYYLELFDWGFTLEEVATIAVASDRFEQAAGSHSNTDFVNTMYFNVAGFLPDTATRDYLVSLLESGNYTQGYIGAVASEIRGATGTDAAFISQGIYASLGVEGGGPQTGSGNDDHMVGRGGNDVLTGAAGDDTIDGGAGIDRAVYTAVKNAYAVTHNDVGMVIRDLANNDTDKLIAVERVWFSDATVAYDILHGNGGTAAKVIGALFGLTGLADKALVGQYIAMLDSGMSEEAVVGVAAASERFGTEAGGHSNQQFAERIYFNIAGFEGTEQAISEIVAILDTPGYSQAYIGTLAAEIFYNVEHINLVGLAQTGIEYTPTA